MIYLRTGSNGTCKTLLTLADVRAMQLKENRPVCINGRFKMLPEVLADFGWRVIDFKDWQAEPDGTIFLVDECHNDLPVRPNGSPVPEPVRMLAEHRSRGFDFFLLTQHPMNIDSFVRKIVGSPGWHQHLKRPFGAKLVSVLQWDAVNTNCEKDGSGKNAVVTMRAQPKEVYKWYESASLHTAKVRIPKQVWILGAAIILVPILFYLGFQQLGKLTASPTSAAGVSGPASAASGVKSAQAVQPSAASGALTTGQYLAAYAERIEGLPQTAPRYDEVTKPTVAPYPAACVMMGDACKCYSQQGTKLQTDKQLCVQIVKEGFFQDWAPVGVQTIAPAPAAGGSFSGNIGDAVKMEALEGVKVSAASAGRDGAVLGSMRSGRPSNAF